jgi:hypothetical protein
MAIEPQLEYPAQIVTTDSGYPYGKARNDASPEATDGTPLEERWVNDLFGFLQALLKFAGIEPSGNPDKYGASQYLEAIYEVIHSRVTGDSGDTYTALLEAIGDDLFDVPIVSIPLIMTLNVNSRFSYVSEVYNYSIYQSDITDAGKLVVPFTLPFSVWRIPAEGFIVGVRGMPGEHSALPGTMPTVKIYRRTPGNPPDTSSTLVGTVTDDSADVGTYEAYHQLVVPNTALDPIDPRDQFLLVFTGEAGANAHVGLDVYGLSVKLYYKT